MVSTSFFPLLEITGDKRKLMATANAAQWRKDDKSQTFGSGNDGLSYMAKGGRAGYKSGGSTGSSKASGCAIRGTSPILLKGKK